MWWRSNKTPSPNLADAQEELKNARLVKDEATRQSGEVVRIVRTSRELRRGNGFYALFREGLKGS